MNEYQRQAYLSSLSIENYMPRLRLPVAPEVRLCALPLIGEHVFAPSDVFSHHHDQQKSSAMEAVQPCSTSNPFVVAEVLRELSETQWSAATPVSLSVSQELPLESILPFSLSIWRPCEGLLVIDSREAHLAFPTELLLRNILRVAFNAPVLPGNEEVLRWPMIQNAKISNTEEDARNTLQVWLEVELEQRPAKYILLMGENAARYFVSLPDNHIDKNWQWLNLASSEMQVLITPSLIELLQQPLLKRDLWRCLKPLRVNL